MCNSELLLAISDLLDQKLEEKLEQKLDEKLDQKLKPLEERLERVEERLKRVEINQENVILPCLHTIAACYADTYKRYIKTIDEHDGMKKDIFILKGVVENHSEKLNQLGFA